MARSVREEDASPGGPVIKIYWKKIQGQAREAREQSRREWVEEGGNQRNYAVNSTGCVPDISASE